MCVFSVAILAACRHLNGRAGTPEQAATLRSDLWQLFCWTISLFPYSSNQVWLKYNPVMKTSRPLDRKLSIRLKGSQEGTLTRRIGILRFREDRTEEIIETCQKGDTAQCNSEILRPPSICPQPDGLAVVIC